MLNTGAKLRYRELAVGCLVTLLVTGANAATESAKSQAQPGTTSQAPAQPTVKSSTSPATDASTSGTGTKPSTSTVNAGKTPAKPEKRVDLNNATLAELKTLPMVGDAEAKKIIANRPYKSKGELVTKAGLPEGVYIAVKYKVELQKPRTSAPKK